MVAPSPAAMSLGRQRLRQIWRGGFEPAPDFTPSQWAEASIVMPDGGARPGPLRFANAPYMVDPINDFADRDCQEITLCWAAQCGKTTVLQVQKGYAICHQPGPGLMVMSNQDQAENYSEERWQKLVDETKAIAAHKPASSDKYRKGEQHFSRMVLAFVGSNSPANLASRPVRYLWLDECDKYPGATSKEAPAVQLAVKRTRSFGNAKKIIRSSTPTLPSGEIWRAFQAGDQRYFWVPCPHCDTYQTLKWERVWWPPDCKLPSGEWDKDRVFAEARYTCESCGKAIHDHDKEEMLQRGEWRATKPRPDGLPSRRRSYHLSAIYAPWVTFGQLAIDWLEAQGNPELLKDFIQSTLAEPWNELAEVASEDEVLAHRAGIEPGYCPELPIAIVLAADVQKHVCYYTVRAWCRHETSVLVDYGVVPGLKALAEIGESVYAGPNKQDLRITHRFIDSGAFTDDVYQFCLDHRWFPTKGTDNSRQSQPYTISKLNNGLHLLNINGDFYKESLQQRLKVALDAPGAWILHKDVDREYAAQLCAEALVEEFHKKTKRLVRYWKRLRPNNHYLDTEVVQLAAAHVLKVRYKQPETAPPAPPPDDGGGFVRRPKSKFFRRRQTNDN